MFSSRLLLNLGLVVFLGLLISLALFNNSEEINASSFSSLKKPDVHLIQVKHNETSIKISKLGDTWNIKEPIHAEADDFRIHSILSILFLADNDYYDIDKTDYKKFSLDKPLVTLTLNQQEFSFGSTSSVNNKRYVLTNKKLFLIDDTIYPLIASGFKNIMSRKLFPSHINLSEISFDNVRVFQNEKLSWTSSDLMISSDELKKFVDNWKHIQAYAVSNATVPYTGTKVTFKTESNKSIVLFLQKTDVNTVVINPDLGLSYQFDNSAFDSLIKPNYYSVDKK